MMLGLVTLVPGLSVSSPSTALDAWRASRLLKWSLALDRRFDTEYRAFGRPRTDLRYRIQALVVDRTGVRARICEAVLDKLCEDVDAPVDIMTSSIGEVLRRPEPALCNDGASLGLSPLPLEAGARRLRPADLLTRSRWDVVVCADLEVLERVRQLARAANALDQSGDSLAVSDGWADDEQWLRWSEHPAGEGTDACVLGMTDFLAASVPRLEAGRLPPELGSLLSGNATAAADRRLVAYLEAVMREHALRAFKRDLTAAYAAVCLQRRLPWEVGWEEVEEALQLEHAVPGGLSDEERRSLFEEDQARARNGSRRTSVDVSDLGLTMDDLTGPMG